MPEARRHHQLWYLLYCFRDSPLQRRFNSSICQSSVTSQAVLRSNLPIATTYRASNYSDIKQTALERVRGQLGIERRALELHALKWLEKTKAITGLSIRLAAAPVQPIQGIFISKRRRGPRLGWRGYGNEHLVQGVPDEGQSPRVSEDAGQNR